MSVRIEVTSEDIANGIRRHPTCCPVASAIRRGLGTIEVDVSRKRIAIDGVGHTPPATVAAFVEGFDNGRRVEPFAFELEVPA